MADRKCMYCKDQVDHEYGIDVCNNCGDQSWGPKLFDTIKSNMGSAENPPELFASTDSDNS
jgi:uncharacterized UBP type Zn finger protein